MTKTIYLDFAATTPVDERVVAMMLPYFSEQFGNPSSVHVYGQSAEGALERSRREVAELLGANPAEIIFTAGGTESDNLALVGTAFARKELDCTKNHLLISPVEHHAVLHTAQLLQRRHGFDLEFLPVDEYGMVDPKDVQRRLRSHTALVSVIYANNEIGTINPVAEIGDLCREQRVPFHTDAVQAAAHLGMNVDRDRIDLLAIGAHKFYGPKGVGALYVRNGSPLVPVQAGGGQEAGIRPGTQNIPYIVGLAQALRITQEGVDARAQTLTALRDDLIQQVLDSISGTLLTGHPVKRLPNHASFVFDGIDGNDLLMRLDMAGFACSSGSACKVGAPKPSEVLAAIGLSSDLALGSLRVTLGRTTSDEDVELFVSALQGLVEQSRACRMRA